MLRDPIPVPTALANITRLATYLGISRHIADVLLADVDRIWCLVRKDRANLHQWCRDRHLSGTMQKDPTAVSAAMHKPPVAEFGPVLESFRESAEQFHPAMHITFHLPTGDPPWLYDPADPLKRVVAIVAEIDLDYSAPVDIMGAIWHFGEVMWRRITRSKTNQKRISDMLDGRIGEASGEAEKLHSVKFGGSGEYFCGADSCDDPACVTHGTQRGRSDTNEG